MLTCGLCLQIANSICLAAHATMAALSFSSCALAGSRSCSGDSMVVRILRSQPLYTDDSADRFTFSVQNAGYGLRFDYITGLFFLASALAHVFALVACSLDTVGAFYWTLLQQGRAPWVSSRTIHVLRISSAHNRAAT